MVLVGAVIKVFNECKPNATSKLRVILDDLTILVEHTKCAIRSLTLNNLNLYPHNGICFGLMFCKLRNALHDPHKQTRLLRG